MPLKKDASGNRSVSVEVEVPGTPEEVWQAIATGSGVSAWFVPTKVETGEDGTPQKVIANFGPGMDSLSTITSWEPPHKVVAESADLGPNAPSVATEWIVEAKSGNTCIVRVVHSLFSSTDDWDNQLQGFESGWPSFFRILRLYLTYFSGQPSSAMQLGGVSSESRAKAWEILTNSLGFTGATVGQRVHSLSGVPQLGGIVERVGEPAYPEELLLRLDEPTPGLAHLFAMEMGGSVYLSIRFYFYGDRAANVVSRDESIWQKWLAGRFPVAAEAASCS